MACDLSLLGSLTNVLKVTKDVCTTLVGYCNCQTEERVLTREEVGLETLLHCCCCTEVGGCEWGGQNALLWVFHSLNVSFCRDNSNAIHWKE